MARFVGIRLHGRVSGDQEQMSRRFLRSAPRFGLRLGTIAALATFALVPVACGGTPNGSHQPSPDQRLALGHAAATYLEDGAVNHCCVPGLRARPTAYEVSDTDTNWATVAVDLQDSSGHPVQPTLVVLHSSKRRWKVINSGNALLGCGVPVAVRKDLGLAVPPTGCG
jgi:hypothetical protein